MKNTDQIREDDSQVPPEWESLCKQLDAELAEPAFYWPDPTIEGFTFKLTCEACPEQYDVFRDGKQVAYIRLRWGRLRVDVPDYGGWELFVHDFDEEFKGMFTNEDERTHWLTKIAKEINKQ